MDGGARVRMRRSLSFALSFSLRHNSLCRAYYPLDPFFASHFFGISPSTLAAHWLSLRFLLPHSYSLHLSVLYMYIHFFLSCTNSPHPSLILNPPRFSLPLPPLPSFLFSLPIFPCAPASLCLSFSPPFLLSCINFPYPSLILNPHILLCHPLLSASSSLSFSLIFTPHIPLPSLLSITPIFPSLFFFGSCPSVPAPLCLFLYHAHTSFSARSISICSACYPSISFFTLSSSVPVPALLLLCVSPPTVPSPHPPPRHFPYPLPQLPKDSMSKALVSRPPPRGSRVTDLLFGAS